VGKSLTRKLIEIHLVAGKPEAGEEIGIAIDQVLLTDTNGTMSWLQFEAMGFPRAVPGRIVSYADHNVYQVDSRNSDDHRYMQTIARRYGAVFSKLRCIEISEPLYSTTYGICSSRLSSAAT